MAVNKGEERSLDEMWETFISGITGAYPSMHPLFVEMLRWAFYGGAIGLDCLMTMPFESAAELIERGRRIDIEIQRFMNSITTKETVQ